MRAYVTHQSGLDEYQGLSSHGKGILPYFRCIPLEPHPREPRGEVLEAGNKIHKIGRCGPSGCLSSHSSLRKRYVYIVLGRNLEPIRDIKNEGARESMMSSEASNVGGEKDFLTA
jgi:hypothetical protein